jgi:hypothetical protein
VLPCRLGETRLSCDLGSEPGEHSQAELVAEQEAQYQGLDTMLVDVKHWCVFPLLLTACLPEH